MKIEQVKQRALKLFQNDRYQRLFEMLYDEVCYDCGIWRKSDDDPEWEVSLKIHRGLQDFQLPFGHENVTVLLNSFEIGKYSGCLGSAFFEQDYRHISLAVGLMGGNVVVVYEYQTHDIFNPGNLYKNSDLIDIHEYHHDAEFYAMLDCYRKLLKLRKARDDAKKEAELQQRYSGKFNFEGAV